MPYKEPLPSLSNINRAIALDSTAKSRKYFDADGNYHKTIPAKDVAHHARNHGDRRNLAIAESLFIVRRLTSLGVVHGSTPVSQRGAVIQTFSATAGYEAAHVMPCQLMLHGKFPYQLHGPKRKPFQIPYLQRTVALFSRVTWVPEDVNKMDSALEDKNKANFIGMFLDTVRNVASGQDPLEAYLDYTHQKASYLKNALEMVRDKLAIRSIQPDGLNLHDAMLLRGGGPTSPRRGQGVWPVQELQQFQANQGARENQEGDGVGNRITVLETYVACDEHVPAEIQNGDLKKEVESETWL